MQVKQRKQILHIDNGVIHGINIDKLNGYEITLCIDQNEIELLRLILNDKVLLPKQLHEYVERNKKLPSRFATVMTPETLDTVDGRGSKVILEFLGDQVICISNDSKCINSNECSLFCALELKLYLFMFMSTLAYQLYKLNDNQYNDIKTVLRHSGASIGLLVRVFKLKINDYMKYSMSSFPVVSQFFWEEYRLGMGVLELQSNERYNYNGKNAAKCTLRGPVTKNDANVFVNKKNDKNEWYIDVDDYPREVPINCASQAFVKLKFRDYGDSDWHNTSYGRRNVKEIKRINLEQETLNIAKTVEAKEDELLKASKNTAMKTYYKKLSDLNLASNFRISFLSPITIQSIEKMYSKGQGLLLTATQNKTNKNNNKNTHKNTHKKTQKKARKRTYSVALSDDDSIDDDTDSDDDDDEDLNYDTNGSKRRRIC